MTPSSEPTDLIGAMSLLCNCVGAVAGERLLIVREAVNVGFYDENAPRLVATAGRSLGLLVYETTTHSPVYTADDISLLMTTLDGFDHVIFFSRVGDQIRFSDNANMPSSTMCYALNSASLNSNFGTACHQGMCEIKDAIDEAFDNAKQIRVTCPRGTDYVGEQISVRAVKQEVTVKRFPLLVPRPIPAIGFSGRVVLSRFLIGTGSNYYDPYCLSLPHDVVACVEGNRIKRFEGGDEDIARVEKHYMNVSSQFDIDPWHIDSWHAGIHPGCQFDHNAETDMLRWSGTAFGNPRLLHFHTCGEYAPGEISWNIVDPTIFLDDVPVWDAGKLFPDRLTNGESILASHPKLAALFANPTREIGLIA